MGLFIFIFISLIITFIASIEFDLIPFLMDTDYDLPPRSLFRNLTYYLPLVKLCFGTPNNQCFDLAIQTSYAFTLIEDANSKRNNCLHQFNTNLSSTAESTKAITTLSIHKHQFQARCRNMMDIALFPNQTQSSTTKHYFLLMSFESDKIKLGFDGYLGLQKEYSQNNPMREYHFAFISYLYNRTRMITRPNYSVYFDVNKKGRLAFGEDNGVYAKCKAKEGKKSFTTWHCDTTDVLLGNRSIFTHSQKVEFDSGSSLIFAPESEGMIILNYIRTLFNYCLVEEEGAYTYLVCDPDIDINLIDEITLKMSDCLLRLKWKYLFKLTFHHNRTMFLTTFIANKDKSNDEYNRWIVGSPGFIGHKMIFDYSDVSIGIIEDDYNVHEAKSLSVVYVALIMVSSGGIFWLIAMSFKFRKNGVY